MLVDVSLKFRNRCLANYGLYHSNYVSATALSWDAMLSMTKVEIDPISDVGMYLFFEKGMRVGAFLFLKNTVKQTIYI